MSDSIEDDGSGLGQAQEEPEILQDDPGWSDEGQPMDLNTVPPSLEADDSIDQGELMRSIFQQNFIPEAERDPFERLKATSMRLSRLRDIYEKKRLSTALQCLELRSKIKIDSDLQISPEDDLLLWNTKAHRLDYMLTVSDEIGLWSIMPNVESDHTFTFNLDLSQPYRDFKAKYAKLGFDPRGRMLYIGKCRSDDVWLALAPLDFIEGGSEDIPPGHVTGDTRLSTSRYRMVVMFFASVLSSIPDRGFTCIDPYGADLTGPRPDFGLCTNIMDADVNTNLRLLDLTRLNQYIILNWTSWVDKAPRNWRSDGFLNDAVPIAITSRYGQNQPIGLATHREQEQSTWLRDRRFDKIRYVTIALATHVSATVVDSWQQVPSENILVDHGEIYDSWDPASRTLIDDLENLPLYDESGKEIRIYQANGKKIPRRGAILDPVKNACGILVNLKTISSLFSSPDNYNDEEIGSWSDEEEAHRPKEKKDVGLSLYPQAFLQDYGHVQANSTMHLMTPAIREINDRFLTNPIPDHHESSDGFPEVQLQHHPVVTGVSCLIYNDVQHRLTTHAGNLDVQKGYVTSTLAGAFALGKKNNVKAKSLLSYCKTKMPHQRFKDRTLHKECPKSLRVESVYCIDMTDIPDKDRNGKTLYRTICELLDTWTRSEITDCLKPHLLVFRPEAFPAVYLWVTYGWCSLLDIIGEQEFLRIAKGEPVSPYTLELTSAIERTVTYASTGNAKVLSSAVMKPLFITRGIIEHGMPTIVKGIYQLPLRGVTPFTVNKHAWPLTANRRGPAICSKMSHILNYDEDQYIRYETYFRIQHMMLTPNFDKYKDKIADAVMRQCVAVTEVAFNLYFQDVKNIVKKGVEADIVREGRDSGNPNTVDILKKRRRAKLKAWLSNGRDILNYDDDNYAILLRAIATTPEQVAKGLPGMETNEMSTHEFATKLFKMAADKNRFPLEAPILPNGSFYPALSVAVSHIHSLCPVRGAAEFGINVFQLTTELLKIKFVPWKPAASGPGAHPRRPVWNCWMSLGKINSSNEQRAIALHPEEALHKAALDAQKAAMSRDAYTSWCTAEVGLSQLDSFIESVSLPTDWAIPQQSTDYVLHTYEYVRDTYDGSKPLHQLALLAAVVLSKCLPNIFPPADTNARLKGSCTRAQTRQIAKGLPWVKKNKDKGMKEPSIFMSMFVTFIIALYDADSPLRKYMATHDNSLGDAWTDKHRPKAVFSFTLLRIGLTWGEGVKAYQSGRFNRNWGLLPTNDIIALLADLRKKMKAQPYGMGDVLITLLGKEKAHEVAVKEGITIRPIPAPRHVVVDDRSSDVDSPRKRARYL